MNISNITSVNNTQSGIKFDNCNSGITVNNCTLTGNDGYGAVMALSSEEITIGSGNTITGNNWPITINPGTFITTTSVIPTTGNTHNDIQSTYGDCRKTGTWHKFSGLDYVITENSGINVGGSLTLEAGDVLRFANGKGFSIWSNSSLNAVGTVSDSIYFVKEPSGSNYYFFQNSGTVNLEYCVFKDNPYYAISNHNLLSLKYSKIVNCENGIYLRSNNSSCVIENNIIDVNNRGIYVFSDILHLGVGNIIHNCNYGIYLNGYATGCSLGSSASEWNCIYGNSSYDFITILGMMLLLSMFIGEPMILL